MALSNIKLVASLLIHLVFWSSGETNIAQDCCTNSIMTQETFKETDGHSQHLEFVVHTPFWQTASNSQQLEFTVHVPFWQTVSNSQQLEFVVHAPFWQTASNSQQLEFTVHVPFDKLQATANSLNSLFMFLFDNDFVLVNEDQNWKQHVYDYV